MPKRVAVTIHNPNEAPAIVHAISSKSVDFYFSFPEEKIIKPRHNSKFIITFLPRSEGFTSTVLNIHTSVGIFPYKVDNFGEILLISLLGHCICYIKSLSHTAGH
jgi:hypothetical protein